MTVEVVDRYDNPVAADNTDQITLSVASGPGSFAGGSSVTATVSGGIATFGNLTLDTAGSYTLSASATGGLTGTNSSSFTVNAAGADHLAFGVQPSNTTAGTPIAPPVKVDVLDQYGNVLTADDSDQVTLSIATTPAGGSFASNSTTTATVSGGIATFGNLVLDTVGNYTLAISGTGGLSGPNSSSFTVSAASIGQLFFSVQPASATAGSTINPAVQVEVLDAFGNALTGDNSDTVTLILANANRGPSVFAEDSNTMTATVSGGVATFSNLVINVAGTYTLAASALGGATGAPSNSFTISPAAAHSFAVFAAQSTVTAGTGFTVGIRARDMFGNTITNYAGSNITLSCSDGQTVDPSSVALTGGRANPVVILSRADGVSLTASATVAGVTIRGTTSTITVVGGFAGPSTEPMEYTFTLYITPASGNSADLFTPALAGQADAAAANGVQESVLENLATPGDDDQAAQQYIANQESILQEQFDLGTGNAITTMDPQTGSNSVSENPVGQTTSVTVDFPPIIRVVSGAETPGAAASFSLTFPEGVSGVNTLANTPDPVTVTALDANGNVVSDYTGTVTLSSTDPVFGQPITYTYTSADQGSHTFYVDLDTAGIQALMVAQSVPSGQAIENGQDGSSTVNGQGLVHIMPDAAVSLVFDVPSTITAGSAEGITLTALDAFGNVATGYTGTATFSSQIGGVAITGLPGSYTFMSADQGSHLFAVSFKSAGSQIITATDSNDIALISQAQVQVTSAAAKLVITSQPASMVTAGNNFGLIVEAVDSHGKLDSNFNGLVTMTLAGNPVHGSLGGVVTVQAVNGIATFSGLTLNRAGAGYTLKATSGSVTTATTRAIAVTANSASQLVLITQPPGTIAAGSPFGLKVAAEDGYGNVIRSFSGSVTLTLASGPAGATVEGNLTATLVKGVATFSGLKITQAGTGYSLTASGALAAATTNLFNVTAGAAKRLAIGARPQDSVTAGRAFGLVLAALDAYGNVVNSYGGKVTLSLVSNSRQGTLSGRLTEQAVAGVITFTDLLLNNAGSGYVLQARSGKLAARTDAFSVVS